MKLDILLRLHNDLTIFNPSLPLVVQNINGRGLIFRQLGKTLAIPYFRNYYFSNKKFKLGILTSDGYIKLMKELENLLASSDIKDDECGMIIVECGTEFYRCYANSYLNGPQLFSKLEFITTRNYVLSKIYLRHAGLDSKTLLKSILNEFKCSKSIKIASTSEV